MKKLSSKDIVRIMREEYEGRLTSMLNEMEIFDSRGTLILGKDLKVIHEPSGFVYTVRGVSGEPGNAKIVLRAPEEPRFEVDAEKLTSIEPEITQPVSVPPLQTDVVEDADPEEDEEDDKKDYGKKAYPSEKSAPKQDVGEVMFVIDQKEFEKHYKEA